MKASILSHNPGAAAVLEAFSSGGLHAHAFLIEGPPGSGRRSVARMLAMAAQCTGQPKPCGECRDCVKLEKEIHPDLLTFAGEGGAKSFHIDKVREIRQRAHITPGEGRCTILLLQDVQTMSVQAQNALLKVLEEPPASALFLLTCDNRASLLETILSRVIPVSLRTPSVEDCAAILAQYRPDGDPAQLLAAARRAGGSVGQALAFLDEEPGEGGPGQDAGVLLEHLLAGREMEALALLQRYERKRPATVELFAGLRARVGERALENDGDTAAKISRLQLLRILAIIDRGSRALESNVGGLLLGTWLCASVRGVLESG